MITLQILEGDTELLDGFPEYITFETDVPATVYYTLDGSAPTEDSLIAVSEVYLPTLSGTVELKAIAISGGKSSEIISTEYSNDSSGLNGPRHSGLEGAVVMRYNDSAEYSGAYGSDGTEKQLSAKDPLDLDIKASTSDMYGKSIDGGKTSRDFINFALGSAPEDSGVKTSASDYNFDPTAKFILIDGFSENAQKNQVVKIVNRPYNNFDPVSNFYTERLGQKEPIITGNFVRSFYNKKTGKYVSYYWESLESRWIRSEQRIELNKLNINGSSSNKFVYRWIQDRALSQLF